MSVVMHPQTERLVTLLQSQLPQSLLLSGPRGIGLDTVARHIAGKQLLAVVQPLNSKEEPDADGTISVDAIRQLHTQTRAKQATLQVVIMSGADRMNTSSQSAFLKLLEEPQSSVHFILTAHHPERLKDTIVSRVQHHRLRPITAQQTRDYIATLGVNDAKKQSQLQYIGEGLPAELTRLATDDDYFTQQATIVGDARTLLQGASYDKLLLAQDYHSDRDRAIQLVEVALRMARRTISTLPQPALLQQMNRLLEAHEQLRANGNVRLVLAAAAIG